MRSSESSDRDADGVRFQIVDGFYDPAHLFFAEGNHLFLGDQFDFASLCSLLYGSHEEGRSFGQALDVFMSDKNPLGNDFMKAYIDDLIRESSSEQNSKLQLKSNFQNLNQLTKNQTGGKFISEPDFSQDLLKLE